MTTGASGYSPWIAAGANGEAAIVWLGSPSATATDAANHDWYFYWARVTGSETGTPTITSGTTTDTPMFTGKQIIPEFEMVRLDADGLMHIGMSVYRKTSNRTGWAIYYQREALPPPE